MSYVPPDPERAAILARMTITNYEKDRPEMGFKTDYSEYTDFNNMMNTYDPDEWADDDY